jgi:hypothetical protein
MIYMSFGSWLQRGGDAAFQRPAITSFDTSGNNQKRNLPGLAAIASLTKQKTHPLDWPRYGPIDWMRG